MYPIVRALVSTHDRSLRVTIPRPASMHLPLRSIIDSSLRLSRYRSCSRDACARARALSHRAECHSRKEPINLANREILEAMIPRRVIAYLAAGMSRIHVRTTRPTFVVLTARMIQTPTSCKHGGAYAARLQIGCWKPKRQSQTHVEARRKRTFTVGMIFDNFREK